MKQRNGGAILVEFVVFGAFVGGGACLALALVGEGSHAFRITVAIAGAVGGFLLMGALSWTLEWWEKHHPRC